MKKILLALGVLLSAGSLQLAAQCGGFYDGFESGLFTTPWVMGTGAYTTTVPNSGSPVGTYHLSLSSTISNSFYQGASATFTPAQPTYASWYMKTNTTNAANGYVVIGNSNIATDNGIIFCYFNSTSGLRFFNSTGYNHPITANTWYHVEARNINWTARNMDIYVDNVLILAGWAFRSPTAMDMDRVHMFSLSASNAEYDEITIGSLPVTATATLTNVSCFGSSDGSASVVASGGNGIFTYSWSPSGGTSATATGLTATSYTCTITDGAGCTTTASVTITEPSLLDFTYSTTDVLCNGGADGSATATPSGGIAPYTYLWSNGSTSSTASGLASGNYSCTVTCANGCIATQSFAAVVNQPALLVASASAGTIACNGGSTTITYSGSGGTAPYSGEGTNTFVVAGTYTNTITDANGCSSTSTTVITEPAVIVTTVSSINVNCYGDSTGSIDLTVSGGTAPFTFDWNNGTYTTEDLTGLVAGTYSGVLTDANGCIDSGSVVITENPALVVTLSISNDTLCSTDGSFTITGENPAGGTFSGPGVSAGTFEPAVAGVGVHAITYSYTDSSGCTASTVDSIFVDVCTDIYGGGVNVYSPVTVFPNPNNGTFALYLNESVNKMAIEITDVQGRVIYTSTDNSVTTGFTKQIGLENEASGIYFMRVVADGVQSVQKISVQK